jgi:hypothetical protein
MHRAEHVLEICQLQLVLQPALVAGQVVGFDPQTHVNPAAPHLPRPKDQPQVLVEFIDRHPDRG